jgi:hypothetical protein
MGGPPCSVEISLTKIEGRKSTNIKDRNGSTFRAPVFMVRNLNCCLSFLKGWRGC